MTVKRKRILVLFPSEWDRRHLAAARFRDGYEFIFHGDALWQFPEGFLRIVRLNPLALIDRIADRFAAAGLDAVISTDEYIGVVIAAAIARRLGLPGGDPARIIRSQHKYLSRCEQHRTAPECVPGFCMVGVPPRREDLRLRFPLFVKPLRGSFSIFAARVDDHEALEKHLDLNLLWRLGLRTVLRPYNKMLRYFIGDTADANRFIAEEVVEGEQVCVDGFVHEGDIHIGGVIDAVMFPGTDAFERFQYPSRLRMDVQERIRELAHKLVEGFGLEHGQFNVEFRYDAARDHIGVIEMHPRMSFQFADMYEDVDGLNSYDLLLDLSVGRRPTVCSARGSAKHAASLVVRKFGGRRLSRLPDQNALAAFRRRHPFAHVHLYAKKGSMGLEMRAMGSYRCALINASADSLAGLAQIRTDVDEMLRFEVA